MKKIFSIIIALIIFGFVVGNKAVAECPPDWFERVINLSDWCPICDANLTLCVRCYISAPVIEYRVERVDFNPPCEWYNIEEYFECINDVILRNYDLFCSFIWKPCEEGYQTIEIWWPLCFQYEIMPDQTRSLRRCSEAWCVATYHVCIQNGNKVETLINSEIRGEPIPPCASVRFPPNPEVGVCYNLLYSVEGCR